MTKEELIKKVIEEVKDEKLRDEILSEIVKSSSNNSYKKIKLSPKPRNQGNQGTYNYGLIVLVVLVFAGFLFMMIQSQIENRNFQKKFHEYSNKKANEIDNIMLRVGKKAIEMEEKRWEDEKKWEIKQLKKRFSSCFDKQGNIIKTDKLCYDLYKATLKHIETQKQIWMDANRDWYEMVKRDIKKRKEFRKFIEESF